jgi:hypothetical protein
MAVLNLCCCDMCGEVFEWSESTELFIFQGTIGKFRGGDSQSMGGAGGGVNQRGDLLLCEKCIEPLLRFREALAKANVTNKTKDRVMAAVNAIGDMSRPIKKP